MFIYMFIHRFKLRQIFPEEFAAIQHPAAAHVKQIHRQHAIFKVISKDVGIITLGSGDPLLFLQLLNRRNQVAVFRRALELLSFGSRMHSVP